MRRVVLVLLLLFTAGPALAQQIPTYNSGVVLNKLTLTSSTAGVQVPGAGPNGTLRVGLKVGVPSGASTPVCLVYVNAADSCAAVVTDPAMAEPCFVAGNGYVFLVQEEHFNGQVCAILKTGTGPITIGYNGW